MTYIYERVSESDFCKAFARMGRKDQFCYAARQALFEYLESLAEDTGEPVELDVIALCCDFSEYSDLAEFNAERDAEYESWDDVADETTVILFGIDSAIVQAF